jgi:hypothetical protein
MTYYLHAIDPNYAAEFADLVFNGKKFGLTTCENYPISTVQFFFLIGSEELADAILAKNLEIVDKRKRGFV